MTQRILLPAAMLAATVALAACSNEPEVIGERSDPQAEALRNAAPVQLPPAIANSRVFRCRDGSIVNVDFFAVQAGQPAAANIRTSEGGDRVRLQAQAEGSAFTAEGYSVSANADEAEIRVPGKSSQTCRS